MYFQILYDKTDNKFILIPKDSIYSKFPRSHFNNASLLIESRIRNQGNKFILLLRIIDNNKIIGSILFNGIVTIDSLKRSKPSYKNKYMRKPLTNSNHQI